MITSWSSKGQEDIQGSVLFPFLKLMWSADVFAFFLFVLFALLYFYIQVIGRYSFVHIF